MFGINTNPASLFAQNNLSKTSLQLNQAVTRLSSGLRVNSSKDDAAGLAISERFQAQIRGQEVAKRNANDGISFMEVADGVLSSVTDNLQRMRELAVQAKTGTLTTEDRKNLDLEFEALSAESLRVLDTTKFNGYTVAAQTGLGVQINDEAGGVVDFDLKVTVGTGGADDATDSLNTLLQSAAAATANNIGIKYAGAAGGFNILTVNDAESAILQIDKAIDAISQGRAKVGTNISRLESTIANLDTSITAVTAARGRIIDADFAKETAALTRAQILQQAGTSVLAQANQLPSAVLSLLG